MGLIESFLYGIYVAFGFLPLYNLFKGRFWRNLHELLILPVGPVASETRGQIQSNTASPPEKRSFWNVVSILRLKRNRTLAPASLIL